MVKISEAGTPIQKYKPSIAAYEPPVARDAKEKRGDTIRFLSEPMVSVPPIKRLNVYMVSILSYPDPKKDDGRPALLLSPLEGRQCSVEMGTRPEVYSLQKDGVQKADLRGRLVHINAASAAILARDPDRHASRYAVYAVFSDPKTYRLCICEANSMPSLDLRSPISINFFIGLRDEPLLERMETVEYGNPISLA